MYKIENSISTQKITVAVRLKRIESNCWCMCSSVGSYENVSDLDNNNGCITLCLWRLNYTM